MKRITVTLGEEEERRLRSEAAARKQSISELVRTKLRRADTCECEPPKLGFIAIGHARPPYDKMSLEDIQDEWVREMIEELDR